MRRLRSLAGGLAVAIALGLVFASFVAAAAPNERVALLIGLEPGAAADVADMVARLGGEVRYTYGEVSAIAATLPATAVGRLAQDGRVTYVEPDRVRTLASHAGLDTDTSFEEEILPWGVDRIDADAVWDKNGNLKLDKNAPATGDGMIVAVLDTGIDFDHADLSDNFLGGWDFVDNDDTPFDEPGPFQGHGTHVSGTIAALDTTFGVIGVAPEVGLRMYRVCSAEGSCFTSAIVAAVEQAVADGANVISMSLSGPVPGITERRAMEFAWESGLVIVAAAGNHGTAQPHYPASFDTVISVGAINPSDQRASFSAYGRFLELMGPGVAVPSTVVTATGREARVFVLEPTADELQTNPLEFTPTGDVQGDVVFVGLATTDDVAGLDLTGKIALIERGEITFKEKVENVAGAGAIGAIIHNNNPGNFFGTLQEPGAIPAVSVSQEDGLALRDLLDAGAAVKARVVVKATDYDVFSGTSMATPHVSGAAALAWSADPSLTNEELRAILQTTAEDLGDEGKDFFYGYGLVDAEAAVNAALGS